MADRHDTVGIDLVAMSVNDALCTGAEPLFFLDYVAMSHDDPNSLEQIVEGLGEFGPLAVAGRGGIVLLIPSLATVEISQAATILSGLLIGAILLFWFIRGNPKDRVASI